MKTRLQVIKEQMETLVNRWKGTVEDPNLQSRDHILRTIDRMKYRNLKKEYDREVQLNSPQEDIVKFAETLFGVKAE